MLQRVKEEALGILYILAVSLVKNKCVGETYAQTKEIGGREARTRRGRKWNDA